MTTKRISNGVTYFFTHIIIDVPIRLMRNCVIKSHARLYTHQMIEL